MPVGDVTGVYVQYNDHPTYQNESVMTMHTRRSALAVGASALIGSTAGCTARIPFIGDDPLTFEAIAATVPDPVLEDTGYEAGPVTDVVVEETVEAGGQSQDVVVTNYQAEFEKSVDLEDVGLTGGGGQEAAVFTVLTTPQVDVLGRAFNPLADKSSAELAAMVQDHYEGVDDLDHVDEESGTVAGESTTVGELEGEATLADEAVGVELTMHVAEAVEVGGDLIVTVGGYPTELQADERADVFAMMESVEHPGADG